VILLWLPAFCEYGIPFSVFLTLAKRFEKMAPKYAGQRVAEISVMAGVVPPPGRPVTRNCFLRHRDRSNPGDPGYSGKAVTRTGTGGPGGSQKRPFFRPLALYTRGI
jgi:hypothetical protein